MCKYSLELATEQFGTTDAAQGDNLKISLHRGFSKAGEEAIVCLRNGTELTLTAKDVNFQPANADSWSPTAEDCEDQPVTFEEREVPILYSSSPKMEVMDILVRPDGSYAMIHYLRRGSTARVLQVPPVDVAAPAPAHELEHAD